MVIIIGSGNYKQDWIQDAPLAGIEHFFETWFGRPCCIICNWNPGFGEDGKQPLDSGGGYVDNYPPGVWRSHVETRHLELMEKSKFLDYAKKRLPTYYKALIEASWKKDKHG